MNRGENDLASRLDFGMWLAGLIDGEGCFEIYTKTTGHSIVRFELHMRADEGGILEMLRAAIGGNVVRGANTSKRWRLTSHADCKKLVDILDRCPLQAKKAKDYLLWRRAVDLKIRAGYCERACRSVAGRPGRSKDIERNYREIADLGVRLRALRKFQGDVSIRTVFRRAA